MARIYIVGSGVVGTATGRGFKEAGHDVTFVDILESRLKELREQGYDARNELVLDHKPSFIFLTLPTPNVGRRYDLSVFTRGVESVGRALITSPGVHTIVVRSTVPPGTTEGLVRTTLERESGRLAGQDFHLAANPEFLRAASAADDFRWPWMTVVGARNKRARERLTEVLESFGGELRTFDEPATAELIKCAHNLYNAAKISFWNEIWLVAQRLGLDHDTVSSTVARSAEGSFNPSYGIRGGAPYGGVCLPKDTNGFLGFAEEVGIEMPLLDAVVRVNDKLAAETSHELDELLDNSATPPIEVTGDAPARATHPAA
jgi:UDPglucose 6-dehydrogenase